MRAPAVLALVTLAVITVLVFVDTPPMDSTSVSTTPNTTSDVKPPRQSDTDSLAWGDRVFASQDEFAAWLERRDASYSDWVDRHPGASPWEDEGGVDWTTVALLVAALAGVLIYLAREREKRPPLAKGSVAAVTRGAFHATSRHARVQPSPAVKRPRSVREAAWAYGRTQALTSPRSAESRLVPVSSERSQYDRSPLEAIAESERQRSSVVIELAPDRPAAAVPAPKLGVDARLRDVWARAGAGLKHLWPDSEPEPAASGTQEHELEPVEQAAVAAVPLAERASEAAPPRPSGDDGEPGSPVREAMAATSNGAVALPHGTAVEDAPTPVPARYGLTLDRLRQAFGRNGSPVDPSPELEVAEPAGETDPLVESAPAVEPDAPKSGASPEWSGARGDSALELVAAALPPRESRLAEPAEEAALPMPMRPVSKADLDSAPARAEEVPRAPRSARTPARRAAAELGTRPAPTHGPSPDEIPQSEHEASVEPSPPKLEPAVAEPAGEATPTRESIVPSWVPEPQPAPVPPPAEAQRREESHAAASASIVCEVVLWRGYVKGQFYARVIGGDRLAAIATSPMFRCRSAPPEETEDAVAALTALIDELTAEGWEPNGQGRDWYARRFMNPSLPLGWGDGARY